MSDGRDGLSEAVHLAAEKRALAAEVVRLRRSHDLAVTVRDAELARLRDKAMRYHDELAKENLARIEAEAEAERLREENRLLRESKMCVHEFDIGGEG